MEHHLLISGYTLPEPAGIWGVDDPSWLVEAPESGSGGVVFALGESPVGKVARLRRQNTGEWRCETLVESGGAYPCHAALVGTTLMVAHYGDGAVTAFPGAVSGPLHQAVTAVAAQPGAHAHGIFPLPVAAHLLMVDLGLDAVTLAQWGAGRPAAFAVLDRLSTGLGTGPRHLAVHPTKPLAYLVTEYSNELLTLRWSVSPPQLVEVGRCSLLPAGWSGPSFAGSVRVSPDGRFILATNRGHDSVVTFTLDGEGFPSGGVWVPSGGSWPRDLDLSDDGTRLAVANQRANQVALWTRNPADGRLTLDSSRQWPQPSCVRWSYLPT